MINVNLKADNSSELFIGIPSDTVEIIESHLKEKSDLINTKLTEARTSIKKPNVDVEKLQKEFDEVIDSISPPNSITEITEKLQKAGVKLDLTIACKIGHDCSGFHMNVKNYLENQQIPSKALAKMMSQL